jgi:hypothetical protein
MTSHDDLFHADTLDDELDALAETMDQPATPSQHAFHSLRLMYAAQAEEETQALERVRQRLVACAAADAAQASVAPHPARAAAAHPPRRPRLTTRTRVIMRGMAAVLVVGALLGGFGAVLLGRQAEQPLAGFHFLVIPSPNTPLAVNALTGITVRSSTDAWAWGEANVEPTNGSGTASNPIQTPLVEHWDGQHWHIVATPPVPYGGRIADIVALAPDNAWAVGSVFITPTWSDNTTVGSLVEHWDGRSWTIMPNRVVNGGLNALAALSTDDIWAVGIGEQAGLIQHWDGRSWQTVANPSQPGAQCTDITAIAPNDIWVVGMDGANKVMLEHWDGSQWHLVPSPAPSSIGPLSGHLTLNALSAVSASDVWAAGVEDPAIPFPNGALPLFEHWDGHTWSVVASPAVTGRILALVTVGPDDVWAVGLQGFGIDTGQQGQGLIEHWDGQHWSLVENPSPQPFTQLSGIARDPTTPGKVWAVGTTGPGHGGDQLFDSRTLIETNH